MYSQPKRVDYLDSLRGLAALAVLLGHVAGAFAWPDFIGASINLPFVILVFDGKAAVAMFFVLSGFVLSKPYVASEGAASRRIMFLPTFYLRRVTRIWIPWFFAFCLSIAAKQYLFQPAPTSPATSPWLNQFWQQPLTASDFFKQCLFLLHDSSRQLLNQDWSLGVELKGSLLIPFFLIFASARRLVWYGVFGVGLFFFLPTGHYYISFMLGVLVARYQNCLTVALGGLRWVARGGVLVLGVILYQAYTNIVHRFGETHTAIKLGWLLTSIGCALVLWSVLRSSRLQSGLNWKPFVLLGKISYSVYLLQFIIILCLLPHGLAFVESMGVSQPTVLFTITLLLGMAATIPVAALTYRLVELPAISLGHAVTKSIQLRLEKSRSPVAAKIRRLFQLEI